MDTSYTDKQYEYNYPEGIENFYWTKARNRIILNEIRKNREIRNSNILDVGCGRGIVTKYLNDNGIKCTGIELAPAAPITGAEKLIITQKNAFEMDDNFKASFQTILLLDVIEHIENPTEFINSLIEHYATVKNIIITVPARKEIWSEYDTFFGHFTRYNLTMISKLLKDLNLKQLNSKYLFHSLYIPGYLGAKQILKRSVKVKPPKGVMKVAHNLMATILFIEYIVFPSKFVGTSIICIASRT